MDIFAGTLTLPIAALKTSRRCIAIEKDQKVFDISVDRLSRLCSPVFKFVVNDNRAACSEQTTAYMLENSTTTDHKSSDSCKSTKTAVTTTKVDELKSNKTLPIEETSMDVDDIHEMKGQSTSEISLTGTNGLTISNASSTDMMRNSIRALTSQRDEEASESLLLLNHKAIGL